jgi:hypothetical protein
MTIHNWLVWREDPEALPKMLYRRDTLQRRVDSSAADMPKVVIRTGVQHDGVHRLKPRPPPPAAGAVAIAPPGSGGSSGRARRLSAPAGLAARRRPSLGPRGVAVIAAAAGGLTKREIKQRSLAAVSIQTCYRGRLVRRSHAQRRAQDMQRAEAIAALGIEASQMPSKQELREAALAIGERAFDACMHPSRNSMGCQI